MTKLYAALLLAALTAACNQKASDRTADADPAAPDAAAVTAPAPAEAEIDADAYESEMAMTDDGMEVGADATNEATDLVAGADDIDVDAEMPDGMDTEVDPGDEFALDEGDVESPAMDEDAIADGDYVEEVAELNELDNEDPVTVEDAREAYGEISVASTLEAFEDAGGLTNLLGSGAVETIDRWIVKLEAGGSATEVSTELRELRGHLTAAEVDGTAVGESLVQLGELTQAAALDDGDLSTLGTALLTAGRELLGQ